MSRLFAASTDYLLNASGSPVTDPPFSVACWFRVSDLGSTVKFRTLWAVANSSNTWHALQFKDAKTASPVQLEGVAAGTSQSKFAGAVRAITASASIPINTWCLAVGVWSATDNRKVYLWSGGAHDSATNTVSRSPTFTSPTVAIGARSALGIQADTFDSTVQGIIRHVCVWNVALTANEVQDVFEGLYFRQQPWWTRMADVKANWPVWGVHSPEPNMFGGGHKLTVNGTTDSDKEPPQLWYNAPINMAAW